MNGSIDEWQEAIDAARAEGAVVILKWDGERASNACTVLITRNDTDYAWRADTDDLPSALEKALQDYRRHHPL
jgi:hypothetical protein